jgi:hypothetical protein
MKNLLQRLAELLRAILGRSWETRALMEVQNDLLMQIRTAVDEIRDNMPGKPKP